MKDYNILDRVFEFREEQFLEEFGKDFKELEQKIKDIDRKEITKIIDNIPKENAELKQMLTSSIDNLVADYNIILAYYNKKYYKQGFEDAATIMKVCEK